MFYGYSFLAILTAFIFNISQAADYSEIQKVALELGCQAAIGSAQGASIICFRDDVIDGNLPTQIQGCSARLYDLEKKRFVGLKASKEDDLNRFLLVPKSCKEGGLAEILKWSLDENDTLESYLKLALVQTAPVVAAVNTDVNTEAIIRLTDEINKSFEKAKASYGARSAAPADKSAPWAAAFAPASAKKNGKHVTVKIFYGSDRKYMAEQSPEKTFTNERNGETSLNLGSVEVSIPANHKIANIEVMPPAYRILMSPDPNQYMVLKEINRLESSEFWHQIQNRVKDSMKKELFVFVHGFNVTFEQAAQRTAQMAYDLKFAGAPVFYSWPSESILRYAIAEKNIEWTLPHLTQFLQEISQKSGATEIHLIAHSMGNRGLTKALERLSRSTIQANQPAFKNVILTAPDVDQDDFRKIQKSVNSMAQSLTLYASNHDKALEISARIHSGPRLGQTGEFTFIAPGMDTIDASAVDVAFLGHSYYGDSPSVVSDLDQLISQNLSPRYRRMLQAVIHPKDSRKSYWLLTPPAEVADSESEVLPLFP